jgi:hypothetical protein
MKQTMNELTLILTLEEVNALLDALGSQPFKQVHQLITKIQTQSASKEIIFLTSVQLKVVECQLFRIG